MYKTYFNVNVCERLFLIHLSCGIFENVPVAQRTLAELNALGPEALKALVLAQQSELASYQTEIENLKLLIFKLKRMQFGRRSEKLATRCSNSNFVSKIWR